MNIFLWIIQGILAIKLFTAAYTHGLGQSRPTIQDAISRLGNFSKPLLYVDAVLMFVGTLGLLLPGLMSLPAWITPLTAGILSILLLVSIFFHLKSREKPNIFVSIVLAVFAVIVAYGRWFLLPFGG